MKDIAFSLWLFLDRNNFLDFFEKPIDKSLYE